MTPDLQAILAELLLRAGDTASLATALTAQELPGLLQEYLVWMTLRSGLLCLIGGIMVGTGVILGRRVVLLLTTKDEDRQVFYAIIGAFSLVNGVVMVLIQGSLFLQVLIVPRVFLLERILEVLS